MPDFSIPGALSSGPMCNKHGAIFYRGSEPWCPACDQEAQKAARGEVEVVPVEDPGSEALEAINKAAAAGTLPIPQTPSKSSPKALPTLPVVAGLSFEEHVSKAVEFLQKAPMPGNMAQFKLVNNAVKSLTKAITPPEEN